MTRIEGEELQITDGKRIVFLGDSITDEGTYITYLAAYFEQHMPDTSPTFINLGISSETASGLTEVDHPFPRPCIYDRLARALQESKPDWVVVGYGMNDGIYAPYSTERFQAYQNGILSAVRMIHQYGAKAIVMTPPPFDPKSMSHDVLMPDGQENYSYKEPYAHYNDVIRSYANWLLTLDATADAVVNIYEPLLQYREQEREMNPDYRSGDGIHPNADGHWVIAKTLLKRLFQIAVEKMPDFVEQPDKSQLFQLILQRQQLLSSAWKEHVGHTNPNKKEALPLEAALRKGEEITKQIRKTADA
ncbi:SGNH/GDSL hydrolase family protein [Paenibacillus frigoriresistens]|uniref:SGNH/GDSL hydrolase family protein n=1 Tax=Paenibacillus alginolyticus TaxID=59839 RepID=UPI001564019F|nr:SGNH/GDSL hydrolase family protein [Paenibacillus frigoriresistens]NRF91669.1 SGNH/GDSL hydrolase family protein [Paenibacillus frigoriresistens]